MIAYLDTSALVKLLLDEPGSDVVGDVWDASDRRVTSVAAYPEGRSALASANRSGRIGRQQLRSVNGRFGHLFEAMSIVELDLELSVDAGQLAERHALRGYDAVHLASALALGPDSALMVTWDLDLARAAEDSGLAVVSG